MTWTELWVLSLATVIVLALCGESLLRLLRPSDVPSDSPLDRLGDAPQYSVGWTPVSQDAAELTHDDLLECIERCEEVWLPRLLRKVTGRMLRNSPPVVSEPLVRHCVESAIIEWKQERMV